MANDVAKRLVARIRELREAYGFTQETFAERADLKYKHYQSVEAGRRPNLQLFTLIKIAKALGLNLKELVDFEITPVAVAEAATERGYPAPLKKTGKASKTLMSGKKSGVVYKRRPRSRETPIAG